MSYKIKNQLTRVIDKHVFIDKLFRLIHILDNFF